jgi:hypothetical protein
MAEQESNRDVVVSEDGTRRLTDRQTGQVLIDAMQASPYREIDIEPERFVMPVRDVVLLRSPARIGARPAVSRRSTSEPG